MKPGVTVILPCYNAAAHLPYAMGSLLSQDHRELTVLCINDGSTDKTGEILESYRKKDPRVRVIHHEKNLGLIATLNSGLALTDTEFFARMDADDHCSPDRLSRQVNFLLKYPAVGLVSSGYHYFREEGKPLERVPPVATLPGAIRFISLFSTPLAHAAVMGRTSLVTSGSFSYNKAFPHAEDFELFSRLAWQGVPMTSLRRSLYEVRLGSGSVSARYASEQAASNVAIIRRNISRILPAAEKMNDHVFLLLANRITWPVTTGELNTAIDLLEECLAVYRQTFPLSAAELREIKAYLRRHRLNMIIQSVKARRRAKMPVSGFILRVLFALRPGHLLIAVNKLYHYLRGRKGP
jgi:glycosyltransferase involved in cell wall biosynthesis